MLENIRDMTYRGSLKSCNYTCSYCPFGKKEDSPEALHLDREAWERFCRRLSDIRFGKPLHLLIAPYGEALLHRYYWESLAELSRKPYIGKVGCQTNLSFSVESFLEALREGKADTKKISLWATFHPEMVETEKFVRQVEKLAQVISLSVGVVGNPSNIMEIQRLRAKLPPWIYLWVNAMDGLGRNYTQEELSGFQELDPMFFWEIGRRKGCKCVGGERHMFVTADGSLYPCNRIPRRTGNLYDREAEAKRPECSGRRCDCYLAYSHTDDFLCQAFWGDGHLFRAPERRKVSALFFDVDGTLVGRDGKILPETKRALQYLAGRTSLFFATELPIDAALRKCVSIRSLFSGGCFSGGAHCVCWNDNFEEVAPLPALPEKVLERALQVEQRQGITCRILLPGVDVDKVSDEFEISPQSGGYVSLVKRGTDKGAGVRTLCEHMGISTSEVMAVGNGRSDAALIRECGYKVAVPDSVQALEGADYILRAHQLAYIL